MTKHAFIWPSCTYLTMLILILTGGGGRVYATGSQNIEAVVRISVCGNNEVEGGEECDPPDAVPKSCADSGGAPVVRRCDLSCSLEILTCSLPGPASPSFEPIISTPSPALSPSPKPSAPIAPYLPWTERLPWTIRQADQNHDGRLDKTELVTVIRNWVEIWKMPAPERMNAVKQGVRCDVNTDGKCDLYDLSVLLYYFDR